MPEKKAIFEQFWKLYGGKKFGIKDVEINDIPLENAYSVRFFSSDRTLEVIFEDQEGAEVETFRLETDNTDIETSETTFSFHEVFGVTDTSIFINYTDEISD